MPVRGLASLVLVAAVALAGCERGAVEVAAPHAAPVPPVAAPAQAAAASTDPTVPPVASVPLTPKTHSDATADTTLTVKERNTQMPLPGQANDHSTPAAAKQGDDTTPAKSPSK